MMRETAYAKINLALHVRARRGDGYHEIETLFAFVDVGDRLTAVSAPLDRVEVVGEFAGFLQAEAPLPGGEGLGVGAPASDRQAGASPPQGGRSVFGNIVALALGALPRSQGLAVALEKNLPVAAGLGGGSADAGAVFRMVREAYGLPDDWQARAACLGADVPACVESTTCIGRGTGTELEPINSDLTGTPALLVNPRIPLATGPVFAAWDGMDRGPLPNGPVSAIARDGRNDLEAPAIALVPEIRAVLETIAASGAFCTRMSGSGATCFGLFENARVLERAADAIARDHPDWWLLQGHLR